MTISGLYPKIDSESTPLSVNLTLFDVPNRKRCPRCSKWLLHSEFLSQSSQPCGLSAFCAPCQKAYGKERRDRDKIENPGKASQYMRVRHLAKTYGLTPEQYAAMKAEQGGVCAICKQPQLEHFRTGRVKELCIDHDHETGKVRGLLCGLCNKGIGSFRDNPRLMTEAIGYLEKHCPSPLS